MASASRILITDGDAHFLATLKILLESEGYDCHAAPDSHSALSLLDKEDYELLITELHMPGNEHFELIRAIPARLKHMPVIVLTANPTWESAAVAYRIPVAAYLEKPVRGTELLEHVDAAVRRHRIYTTVCSTRKTVTEWVSNMDNLKALLEASHLDSSGLAIKSYMASALRNIFGAVANVARLVEALPLRGDASDLAELPKSPRTACLEAGLQDAVQVLEATKRSFKSKEIAELRKRLETLLASDL